MQLENVSKLRLVMLQGAKKDMYMYVTASIKCSYPHIFSVVIIGSLSNDVFERRTSTGSEAFSLLICL